ncbi:unnamed protein product [Brassica rapa]|uniref:Uncharacterized protein n=1 Tax=Brassica campestris TaxID=3711 RepID=A0A8D9GYZ4_BRACM|nr:unnamed protein product [Brassica rapa]
MLHAGDEYLISTLFPFEPAQISFDPREFFHLLLIFLNQPSFDNLVGLSASRIGATVNLVLGSVLTCEKKPAHSDNNNAPAVKLPTEIVEITSDPRTSEEDKVEMPADAY